MPENVGTIPPKYNMNEVYSKAFSHIQLPYPNLVRESRTVGVSPFGTIKALKGSFKLKSTLNVDYALPTMIDGWQIPQEPLVKISVGKSLVTTDLTRGDLNGKRLVQSVIEEINLENYQVKIRGVILNEEDSDTYPEDDIRRLREAVEKPGSIEIINGLTTLWGISKICVQKLDLMEVQGILGAQAFEITALSDTDFELEVIDSPERL